MSAAPPFTISFRAPAAGGASHRTREDARPRRVAVRSALEKAAPVVRHRCCAMKTQMPQQRRQAAAADVRGFWTYPVLQQAWLAVHARVVDNLVAPVVRGYFDGAQGRRLRGWPGVAGEAVVWITSSPPMMAGARGGAAGRRCGGW